MVQAAGLEGVWQCTRFPSHEFNEDPDETADLVGDGRPPAAQKRGKKEEAPSPERCPKCRAIIKTDDLGLYCDSAKHEGIYRPPKDQPYWLSHLGITAPLQDVRQSNITDGSLIVAPGPLQFGGGSKSGRKRKKPAKSSRGPMSGYYDT